MLNVRRWIILVVAFGVVSALQVSTFTFGAVSIGPSVANACCPVRPCNGGWAPEPVPGTDPLLDVSADSIHDAWAVGGGSGNGGPHALLEHFAGETAGWSFVFKGSKSSDNEFFGVDALSGSNVWAVGYKKASGTAKTYIVHYDGTTFARIASPNATGDSFLESVSLDSAGDGWAVGYHTTSAADAPLIEQWDGVTWSTVSTPDVGDARLLSVVAISPSDAWAVGFLSSGSVQAPLTEHWDGVGWSVVRTPDSGDSKLLGVTASSADKVWASGSRTTPNGRKTLIEYWDGSAWSEQATPDPGNDPILEDVSAASSGSAWAVGYYVDKNGNDVVLVEHWDGSTWSVDASAPSPGTTSYQDAVSAVSATDVWTVGFRLHNTTRRALTERHC